MTQRSQPRAETSCVIMDRRGGCAHVHDSLLPPLTQVSSSLKFSKHIQQLWSNIGWLLKISFKAVTAGGNNMVLSAERRRDANQAQHSRSWAGSWDLRGNLACPGSPDLHPPPVSFQGKLCAVVPAECPECGHQEVWGKASAILKGIGWLCCSDHGVIFPLRLKFHVVLKYIGDLRN